MINTGLLIKKKYYSKFFKIKRWN